MEKIVLEITKYQKILIISPINLTKHFEQLHYLCRNCLKSIMEYDTLWNISIIEKHLQLHYIRNKSCLRYRQNKGVELSHKKIGEK